ncbi:MAG TPA: YlxR family protein [Pseudonocardiaceae bacterium]|nr:YlxR family protein [Pseudonocardiaceae bacterium]
MARRQGAVLARRRSVRASSGSEPIRTCVGCRVRAPATGLLRVVAVDGTLVPDPPRRLPGRGAWLHPDPDCLRAAERRRVFPRALRVHGPLDASGVRAHLEQPTQTAGPDLPDPAPTELEAGRPVMNQP